MEKTAALFSPDVTESDLIMKNFTGGEVIRAKMQKALEDMLQPERKVHKVVCLHSDQPHVTICNVRRGEDRDVVDKGKSQESRLALSLYFKRCDGTYKNINGELL